MLQVALILCLVGCSFQGGVKPQQSGAASPVYQPEYVQGSQQPGASGPLGAKAGGLSNGYGRLGQKSGKLGLGQFPQPLKQKPGFGKPSKSGYGAGNYPQFGAQTGNGNYPQNGEQAGFGKPSKSGYGAGNYPQFGAQKGFGKPSKSGYGAGNYPQFGAQTGNGNYPQNGEEAGYRSGNYPQFGAQAGYGNGAGLYPSNFQQQGYRNGFGGYPSNFQQHGKSGKPPKAGYGNGAGILPNADALQSGIGKPSKAAAGNLNSFFPPGGFGNQPYRTQPMATDSLGYDTKNAKSGVKHPYDSQAAYPDLASKYAGAGQIPFTSQPGSQSAVEEDVTPSSPVDVGHQQPGGGPWTYAPEESSYRQNGFYGNGYRGCSGKC